MKAENIETFFGTLLDSVSEAHKEHLATGKYSNHKALQEYYEDFPDLIDDLTEHYIALHGKVGEMKNVLEYGDDPIKYFENLREFAESGKDLIEDDETELRSDLDAILGAIDSTLYQLKELKENKGSLYESMSNLRSLSDYISEKCCKSCKEEEEKKCKKCELCEEEVTDEKSFREYAMQVLKKMHGDDFDEDKAKETIDGLINDKKDDENWGALIGKLNKK